MTFLFSFLRNPIWFSRLFVASSALVLLLSFFSYRQIRGQLGFASPSDVMYSAPESDPVATQPVFNPVNRNKAHLENVCRVKPGVVVGPKKHNEKKNIKLRNLGSSRQKKHFVSERELLKRERALQQRAAEQQEEQDAIVTNHIISHNGKIRYVDTSQKQEPEKVDDAPPRIELADKVPKQRVTRRRVGYNGTFSLPIKRSQFWLSSPFGPRRKANGRRGFHQGIDLAAVRGTPVMAAGDGVVVFAGNGGPFGNLVIIEHDERCRTYYAHMSAIKTHVGAQVSTGKVVGLVGATGYVRKRRGGSGDHLHFGVYVDGRAVNPVHYLN